MSHRSAQLSLAFSCLGHTATHLYAPIFYVVALTLEGELGLSHGDTIALVVTGNLLYGFASPIAGWLGDRWRTTGMMLVFFLGCGGGMIATGLASTPLAIAVGLAVTGVFGSIYHPVGIAWMVKNAENRGMALGINGVFGGIGPGIAALSAGALIAAFGWRSAFIVPGALVMLAGLAFAVVLWRGWIVELTEPRKIDPPASTRDMVTVFTVLMATMLCNGLIYQASQAAMPKLFAERLGGGSVLEVGTLVAVVYLASGAVQVGAGHLADRYRLRTVYILGMLAQAPVLALMASVAGGGLMGAALVASALNVGVLPAENSMVARYSPSRWHGLSYGLKFILSFGIAGLGARLEGYLYDLTGGFAWLFYLLAAAALVAAAIALLLPTENRTAEAEA